MTQLCHAKLQISLFVICHANLIQPEHLHRCMFIYLQHLTMRSLSLFGPIFNDDWNGPQSSELCLASIGMSGFCLDSLISSCHMFSTVQTDVLGTKAPLGWQHCGTSQFNTGGDGTCWTCLCFDLHFGFKYTIGCDVSQYISQYCRVAFFYMTIQNVLTPHNVNTTLTDGRSPIFDKYPASWTVHMTTSLVPYKFDTP